MGWRCEKSLVVGGSDGNLSLQKRANDHWTIRPDPKQPVMFWSDNLMLSLKSFFLSLMPRLVGAKPLQITSSVREKPDGNAELRGECWNNAANERSLFLREIDASFVSSLSNVDSEIVFFFFHTPCRTISYERSVSFPCSVSLPVEMWTGQKAHWTLNRALRWMDHQVATIAMLPVTKSKFG